MVKSRNPSNALLLIDVTEGGILIVVRFVQPLKASFPMFLRPSGKLTTVRLLLSRKAEAPILTKPSGKFTVRSDEFRKTLAGNAVTPSGTVISVRLVAPRKIPKVPLLMD